MPFISELTQKMKKYFKDMFEKPNAFQKDTEVVFYKSAVFKGRFDKLERRIIFRFIFGLKDLLIFGIIINL